MGTLPGKPPMIPGFHFLAPLGAGGFSDVYLYEQDMPRRKVAVKVLHQDALDGGGPGTFVKEANAMAALSSHPSILTIHQASISSDGRPYFVLEYAKESMGDRFRNEYLPVDEVVATGVRIGAALETLHRSGMLHRDIKPSNLLIDEFGRPMLSDFGIVGIQSEADGDSVALSVPWSAPEVVSGDSAGTVATEVWSLGATLYALLAGHSPFEARNRGNNTEEALKKRIRRAKYEATDRSDVPPELEAVLAKSMAAKPTDRYRSVEEMVGALQAVEMTYGWPRTEYLLSPIPAGAHPVSQAGSTGLPVRSEVQTGSARKRVARETSSSQALQVNEGGSSSSKLTKRQVGIAVAVAIFGTAIVVAALMMWLGG